MDTKEVSFWIVVVVFVVIFIFFMLTTGERNDLRAELKQINENKLAYQSAVYDSAIDMIQRSRIESEIVISDVIKRIHTETGIPVDEIHAITVLNSIEQNGKALHRAWKPEDFKQKEE